MLTDVLGAARFPLIPNTVPTNSHHIFSDLQNFLPTCCEKQKATMIPRIKSLSHASDVGC